MTRTPFKERGLYLRFLLDDYASTTFGGEPLQQPTVIYGVFSEVVPKQKFKKLEDILSYIEYRDTRVFARLPAVDFEDTYVHVAGTFEKVSLFALADAASVAERLAKPAVTLYRSVKPRQGHAQEPQSPVGR